MSITEQRGATTPTQEEYAPMPEKRNKHPAH